MLCGGQINKTDEEGLFDRKDKMRGRKYDAKINNFRRSL